MVDGDLEGAWQCPDIEDGSPMATAILLSALAEGDEPFDSDAVASVLACAPNVGRAAHRYVRQRVRFRDEAVETFASPAATMRDGAGDCDDSERALVSLARAAGLPARFVFFLQDGQPAHVSAQVFDGGAWRWAETTIAARYGEHPFKAMRRLHLRRADLDGTPYILVGDQAVPLGRTKTMMGALVGAPSYLGDTFDDSLVAWSESIGAAPLDVVKLLLSESGLQPTARNTSGFASGEYAAGINQLAPGNWSYFAPYTAEQYTALTAEQQLPYVFAYWSASMKSHGLSEISARDLYALNFLPAYFTPNSPDSAVLVSSSSGYYTNNSGLDHGGKGFITYGDMQQALDAQPAQHPTLWPLLSNAIGSRGSNGLGGGTSAGPSTSTALGVILAAAAAGALLARPELLSDLVDAIL